MDWEERARQLQLDLYEKAEEARAEAVRVSGSPRTDKAGPIREAEAWAKAAGMAYEAFGSHPGAES